MDLGAWQQIAGARPNPETGIYTEGMAARLLSVDLQQIRDWLALGYLSGLSAAAVHSAYQNPLPKGRLITQVNPYTGEKSSRYQRS